MDKTSKILALKAQGIKADGRSTVKSLNRKAEEAGLRFTTSNGQAKAVKSPKKSAAPKKSTSSCSRKRGVNTAKRV